MPEKNTPSYNHWSDHVARSLIHRHRNNNNEVVCAAGISPSGTVHIGNFREIIVVDLIYRAVRDRDIPARFLHFWDDYDAMRAVPAYLKERKEWQNHLRRPLSNIPDPHEKESSYARYNEQSVEELLPLLGITPEYIYQHTEYQKCAYTQMIQVALKKRSAIRNILNAHRHTPLEEHWWPITVYSAFTGKDTTTIEEWDEKWHLIYRCNESGNSERIDIRTAGNVKLRWRIDWPMRWAHRAIDFEPAGKDHHSQGGSYDTAREIATKIFGITPPISIQYDFVRIKGGAGKMSSSSGELLSIREVLNVYQPEVIRYLFVSARPNVEFAISFDVDVIKIYEDYDKCERIAYGMENVSAARAAKERRIYDISQCHRNSARHAPLLQIPFRHLCNLLQIYQGDITRVLDIHIAHTKISPKQKERIRQRAICAWNWIVAHAPPNFKFTLTNPEDALPPLTEVEQKIFLQVSALIHTHFDTYDEKGLHNALYEIANNGAYSFKELCQLLYLVLIARKDGPKLAHFMILIGRERLLQYLNADRIR